MFAELGRITARHPWIVCLLWVIGGVSLARVAPPWDAQTQDDDVRFIPDRYTSVRAHQLMEKAFPQDVMASNLVFVVEREEAPLTESDMALVDAMVKDLEKLRQDAPELKLGKVDSHSDGLIGNRLVSYDRKCTLIKLALSTPYLALATADGVDRARETVMKRLKFGGVQAPKVYSTGAAGVGRDLTRTCATCLDKTTIATIILVVTILLLVYRAPLLALIPLITIAASVWVALNVLALLTLLPGVHLVNISKVFAIVILYGAGTDYCLFLISRYREELEAGKHGIEALAASVGGVGEALAASAATVMVGLGLMGLAEFAKVRYAGPAIALSLGVALLASLTLTPALLRLFGRAAFWPVGAPGPARLGFQRRIQIQRFGFWDWISHRVAARPVLVWLFAVAILLPLAAIGLRVQSNYCATSELSPQCDSLQGLAAIKRHYTAGEIGPVTVLLVSRTDWNSHAGRREIDHLSRGFGLLDNVAEVRSFTQPMGAPFPDFTPEPDGEGLIHRLMVCLQPGIDYYVEGLREKARQHYIAEIPPEKEIEDPDGFEIRLASAAGSDDVSARSAPQGNRFVTRLDIVLKSDPFTRRSGETLKTIKTWLEKELPHSTLLPEPPQSECFGVTANAQDLEALTESDRFRVNGLVILAIFVILLILVNKFWMAGYLLVTVMLSYFAALGATVLAGTFWTGAPLPYVDWRVPFFLFTILVAVGEDYNILLVTRAIQERKRYGMVEGMRRALARTGGAITSCGLIMAGTFATLMLAGLNTLVQIGFALAIGVLIDTFLVRPFLVPAFAMLFWSEDEIRPASKIWRQDPAPMPSLSWKRAA